MQCLEKKKMNLIDAEVKSITSKYKPDKSMFLKKKSTDWMDYTMEKYKK